MRVIKPRETTVSAGIECDTFDPSDLTLNDVDQVYEDVLLEANEAGDHAVESHQVWRPDRIVIDMTGWITTAIVRHERRVALDELLTTVESQRDAVVQSVIADLHNQLDRMDRWSPQAKRIWCFDSRSNRVVRMNLVPNYKFGRVGNFDYLLRQSVSKQVNRVLQSRGEVVRVSHCFEADDLIAHAVRAGLKAGQSVEVISSDGDLHQLFCWIKRLGGSLRITGIGGTAEATVTDDLNDWLWIKAAQGDAGDNLHGLRGFGHTKAVTACHNGLTTKQLSKCAKWLKVGRLDEMVVVEQVIEQNKWIMAV